jgi:cell division septal protein FtsQ
VRITVEEREPVAVVDDGSGRVIGEDGTVLPGAATRGLTEIDEVTGTDLRTAGAVLAAIPPERRTEVARITADVGGTLTLELRSGALVRYGAPEDLVAKGAVLAAVLERLEADGERATRIDVTAPSAPTVT